MTDPMTYKVVLEIAVMFFACCAVVGIAVLGAHLYAKRLKRPQPKPILKVVPASPESEHLMAYTYAQPPMAESADSTHPCFKPQIELIRSDKVKP